MVLDITEPASEEAPRNIPVARFLENIEDYVGEDGIPGLQGRLQTLYSKYKFMEENLGAQKEGMSARAPDIEDALKVVRRLKKMREEGKDEPQEMWYLLAENVWAKAKIPPETDKCLLWLGANTMMEYPLDEAEGLLEKNLTGAKESIVTLEKDLQFLRRQTTTLEVDQARVHNHQVAQRRKKEKEGGGQENGAQQADAEKGDN
uniref:Prefoldin subunit 3 n=1 Tax=Chromera velia CCMP2878 TaxID=1169474 RepID=A0A0G4EZL8_9ALVE|eukprot:Cvel_14342.t1-p1 / transcript=Cvel_14342.t1 / gene=Cvel_14342 / organism=Chromera_velia_CCMP2878 / gene_product=Prefoldin subunit 3, putative / transcript_product=Prefoldin subunit 3, putative / location=Cvel_scaffold1016:15624-19358(+) / protein_length=203 / sequence_SO=supercontig / SO=protein_coding / is_pseudo=false